MNKKDFLFEIGVEEIPAGYIHNVTEKIKNFFKEKLADSALSFGSINLYSTPRRFAIKIMDLQTRQEDQKIERIGPASLVAYGKDGKFTKAAIGFLKGAGAVENDVYTVSTPKGDKIAVKLEKKGSETGLILKQIITELIDVIPFPKTMKWQVRDLSFARPIRWLLLLWGDEVLELEFKGLRSDKITYGNRFFSLDTGLTVMGINEYEDILEAAFVIPDRKKRRQMISQKLETLFSNIELNIVPDDQLLEIVTDLVEYPEPVIAEFNQSYLALPEKIITSTLSQHQKYFSVMDGSKKLTNKFVFVSNGDPKYKDLIRLGNEKVIKARLEDADFFYNEDIKLPFENYVPQLKEVTFQQDLGNLFEKTERIRKNVEFLADVLEVSKGTKKKALRAAELCKADLVTLMLGEKEFTKLQGYIGWKYAETNGEDVPVPLAIFEHYLPRWQKDQLPSTIEGSLVAIADKIDTICGIMGVGMIPTGSKDPFALRRAANGVVQIIADKKMNIDLNELLINAFRILNSKLEHSNKNLEVVQEFMKQRINWYLQENKIEYDVIDSVMHIDHNFIPDLWDRAEALQKLKITDDFINLVTGFKRVSNIIEGYKDFNPVKRELLKEDVEIRLYDEFVLLREKLIVVLAEKDYSAVLALLVAYGKSIDKFFDDVLVNIENKEIRENRYNLLHVIKELFLNVADISKIVIEGN